MDNKQVDTVMVSVIVPVYNTAPYLEECVCSVVNQTYHNWEMLLVDDGSTDESPQICERLKKEDKRIRLFSCQKNRGVSHARNIGIENASGTYLFFLDSDDVLHPRMLEEMMKRAKEGNVDVLLSTKTPHSSYDYGDIPSFFISMDEVKWTTVFDTEIIKWWFDLGMSVSQGMTGCFLKKERIGNLQFDETIDWGEDTLFLYFFLLNVRQGLSFTQTGLYYYRKRSDQASCDTSTNRLQSSLNVYWKIRDSESSLGRRQNAIAMEQKGLWLIKQWFLKKETAYSLNANVIQTIAYEATKEPLYKKTPVICRLSYRMCLHFPLIYKGLKAMKRVFYDH